MKVNKSLLLIVALISPFIGFSQKDTASFAVSYFDKKEVVERQNITIESLKVDSNRNTLVVFYQENSSSNTDVGKNDFLDLKVSLEGCNMTDVYIVNHNLREGLCPMFLGDKRAYTNTKVFFKPAEGNHQACNGGAILRKLKEGMLTEVNEGFYLYNTNKVLVNCIRTNLHKYLLFVDEIKEVSGCTVEEVQETLNIQQSKQAYKDTLLFLRQNIYAKDNTISALNDTMAELKNNLQELTINKESNEGEIAKLKEKIEKLTTKRKKKTSLDKIKDTAVLERKVAPESINQYKKERQDAVVLSGSGNTSDKKIKRKCEKIKPKICFDDKFNVYNFDKDYYHWFDKAKESSSFDYFLYPKHTGVDSLRSYTFYIKSCAAKYDIVYYGLNEKSNEYDEIGNKSEKGIPMGDNQEYYRLVIDDVSVLEYSEHKLKIIAYDSKGGKREAEYKVAFMHCTSHR